MDDFEEGFPTGLGVFLPAPRLPHPTETLPPRFAAPRDGGPSYRPVARRPHLGLSVPPPLVRPYSPVGRPVWLRATATVATLVVTAALLVLAGAVGPWAVLAAVVVVSVAFALAAERVSYRRQDALLLVVPIVGVPVLTRVVWRLTALPDRPWPPRVDELAPPVS